MTEEQVLNSHANFTWMFSHIWFVETETCGNFIWSDPDYKDGTNTLTQYNGDWKDFYKEIGHVGRDKGNHLVKNYCANPTVIFNKD